MAGVSGATAVARPATGACVDPAGRARPTSAASSSCLRLGAVPGGRAERRGSRRPRSVPAALREIDGDAAGPSWWPSWAARSWGSASSSCSGTCRPRGGLCAEIESVHVHPDHRGTGVGGALLRDAIDRARGLGCYRVQLTSNVARPDAHRFYERLGFVALPRRLQDALSSERRPPLACPWMSNHVIS